MIGVLDTCKKCGKKFLRGIYPQKLCDQCSMKKSPKAWSNKKEGNLNNKRTKTDFMG